MKTLKASRFTVRRKVFEYPTTEDFDHLITEPTTVVDRNGDPLIVYTEPHKDHSAILSACRRINYHDSARGRQKIYSIGADNKYQTSRLVGFMPRRPGRADFCRSVSCSTEHPKEHATICDWATYLTEHYAEFSPRRFEAQKKTLEERVLPCWRLGESVFTSGIVNRNNALPYHKDSGNFSGVWSCMLGMQRDMKGGHLVVPRYRLAFSMEGVRAIYFDGQGTLHGVLPFVRQSRLAHRYTIVYYALKLMCHCKTPEEELTRTRRVKTERERSRRS